MCQCLHHGSTPRTTKHKLMKPWKQVLRIIGYGFFTVAALVFAFVLFISCHRWTVLERPVRVEEGSSFSQTFTVDRTETYEIGIQCQKTVPFDTLKDTLMQDLDATFSVHEGQTLVDDNSFPDQWGASFARDYIFKGFGKFEAKPWHTYRVDVRFNRSLPVLASTHPVALVQVEPIHKSGAAVATIIYTLLALILALPGTILVQPYYNAIRRQRRLDAESPKPL